MPHPAPAPPEVQPDLGTGLLSDLRTSDDATVLAMLSRAEDRQQALGLALAALAPAGRWAGPHGVVRLDVVLPDGTVETWVIRFDLRGVRLAPTSDPDVALRVPLAPLVRLLTGQADGALLLLAGELEVIGREDLVLELGSAIRTGPDRRRLVDPAALDPVAVSRAIGAARPDQVAAVMAGGFRELVLSEVFRRLPGFVVAEKAARVAVAIGFEIGGRTDGAIDRYVVRIRDGDCTVTSGAAADEPVDATLELEGDEFLRLVLGHLNPVRGVLSGQVSVRGQVVKALGFNAVMRIPGS